MKRLLAVTVLALAAALPACDEATAPPVVETVTAGPLVLDLTAEGTLKAAEATVLKVPGGQWSSRQLVWMLPEGSVVEKGELLARFSTESGKLNLAEAMIELERNALARAAKRGELGVARGRVAVDLSQVAVELAIAERYAGADLSTMARNEVLDAIQDVDYLGAKQDTLEWKQDQSQERGAAELAVLDAQRATIDLEADRQRDDLAALELRAPHDGILMLSTDWAGEKPTIGANMRAGNEFGKLPDTGALEVELALPQLQAQGVEVGNAVELSPLGKPDQVVQTRIGWVASAAKVMSRDSPIKYLTMKASVPAEAALRYGWVPGQRMRARIVLLRDERALSVPNVALRSEAGQHYVQLRVGDGFERREVKLGVRASARSQVLAGLEPGDVVLLSEGAEVAPVVEGEDASKATASSRVAENKEET